MSLSMRYILSIGLLSILLTSTWSPQCIAACTGDHCLACKLCGCKDVTINCDSTPNYILEDIPTSYTRMYYTNQQLDVIASGSAFMGNGYSNLNMLYMDNDQITSIETLAFAKLVNVHFLQLQNNNIPKLQRDAFRGLSSAAELVLQHNLIELLESGSFAGLMSLETLDLANNNIQKLTPGAFHELGMLNLLNLDHNQLLEVAGNVFSDGASSLQILFLSNNLLEWLPWNSFSGLGQLDWLDLAYNLLDRLDLKLFNDLASLTHLDLSHNSLTTLDPLTFRNLRNLKTLHLHANHLVLLTEAHFVNLESLSEFSFYSNRLETIHPSLFAHMQLEYVDFHDNPWKCDCMLLPLRIWLEQARSRRSIDVMETVHCRSTPEHRAKNNTLLEDIPNSWICDNPSAIHVEGDGTTKLQQQCLLCGPSLVYSSILLGLFLLFLTFILVRKFCLRAVRGTYNKAFTLRQEGHISKI